MKIYETPEGVEQYFAMSDGYDMSEYRELLLSFLPEGKTLLELGMGPGNDFAWLSEFYTVTGSDYSKEFISRAEQRFPGADLILLDAVTLDIERTFDALFSSKVYQHIPFSELKRIFKRQRDILNDKGLIIHSFWIGGKTEDIEDMRFYYHDKKELCQAVSEDFEILFSKTYEEFEEGDSLFLIGRKR